MWFLKKASISSVERMMFQRGLRRCTRRRIWGRPRRWKLQWLRGSHTVTSLHFENDGRVKTPHCPASDAPVIAQRVQRSLWQPLRPFTYCQNLCPCDCSTPYGRQPQEAKNQAGITNACLTRHKCGVKFRTESIDPSVAYDFKRRCPRPPRAARCRPAAESPAAVAFGLGVRRRRYTPQPRVSRASRRHPGL